MKTISFDNKNIEYIEALAERTATANRSLMEGLEAFLCEKGKTDYIDEMRYCLHCQSDENIGCAYLPPCKDVLVALHEQLENYQAKIWRESFILMKSDVETQEHGTLTKTKN